jgi:hypothetical protein
VVWKEVAMALLYVLARHLEGQKQIGIKLQTTKHINVTRYNRDQFLPTTSFLTTETDQVSETLGVNSEVGSSPKKSPP